MGWKVLGDLEVYEPVFLTVQGMSLMHFTWNFTIVAVHDRKKEEKTPEKFQKIPPLLFLVIKNIY